MCGIAGIVQNSGNSNNVNSEILKKMSDAIIHRGPDSEGNWVSEDYRCGFAFRRLSIIDLSSLGNQPMSTEDGRYTIVFNGEIYNHSEIREELKAKGYKYKSNTDTETILYGYIEFGKSILQKLRGMWAIAIWDDKEKKLFCSRDRIGIKPFYYYYHSGVFVFSSEIKALLKHPKVIKEFNVSELPNYLGFGSTTSEDTLYRNIKKIPAASTLELLDGKLSIEQYWTPFQKNGNINTEYRTPDDASKALLALLRESVSDRMMSDVPFGVFLSGGIDSSVNVALMDELMDRPVDTFTVGFKDLEKYNELEHANRISKIFSTNHHEILINSDDGFDSLENIIYHQDEPNADPVCIPLYHLSKLTRDSGTTVIQVGEGSDEQFIGYKWMMRDLKFYNSYWKFYDSFPNSLKKFFYSLAKPIFGAFNQYLALDYIRRSSFGAEFYRSGVPVFPNTILEMLLINANSIENTDNYLKNLKSKHQLDENLDMTQKMLFFELKQRLAELLLMRVDKMTMAHSLEARVPFLDHRIVEFSMNLPESIKVTDYNNPKSLLKNAVKGILPDDIINRKKQGFAAPVSEWLKSKWFSFAEDSIINSKLTKNGVLNSDFVKYLLNSHKENKQNFGNEIYSLLVLSLWYKQVFE